MGEAKRRAAAEKVGIHVPPAPKRQDPPPNPQPRPAKPANGMAAGNAWEQTGFPLAPHRPPPKRTGTKTKPEVPFPLHAALGGAHACAFALIGATEEVAKAILLESRFQGGGHLVGEAVMGAAISKFYGKEDLAEAYRRVAAVAMDVVARRAGLGSRYDTLDDVQHRLHLSTRGTKFEKGAMEEFLSLRRNVSAEKDERIVSDPGLEKTLARIRGLREKTTDRGCTEDEAMAAAEKVAELMDRYGIETTEESLRGQTCESAGFDTGRKKSGAIDNCLLAIGRFCGCRAWMDTAEDGTRRNVFFGLPADVAGASYLYERVEAAFETETDAFKSSEAYFAHPDSGSRRSAVHSFQLGLASGISRKLDSLLSKRDAAKEPTGRAIVVAKDGVIEDELDLLGMSFTTKRSSSSYRCGASYEEGRKAGEKFQHTHGIGFGA